MVRHISHRTSNCVATALACVLSFLAVGNAVSQETAADPTASRQQLYEELAREADALDRYFGLLKKVARVVKPTVVHIEARRQEVDNFSRRREVEEAGSGVIIEFQEKFYVLTNRHVVKRTALNKINIQLADGRLVHPAKVMTDPGTDVAIMAIAVKDVVPAKIGDSDKLEIGEFVLAVGSPFGLSHSITYGIVSAKGRRDLELGDDGVRYQDFLQTDAAINPGNSGGPLINLRGELVGINTAIASSSGGNEGIGFTIPINMSIAIAKQLITNGRVVRAFLGVHLDADFGPEDAASIGLPSVQGAKISGITPNSPAQASNLKTGDVILRFNGFVIEDDGDLVNRVSLTPVNKEVTVMIYRNRQTMTIKVKVGDRADFDRQR